jgi:hypothetical protein
MKTAETLKKQLTAEELIGERVRELSLPIDLRYDGVLMGWLAHFTELNREAPSYGASFTVLTNDLTLDAIMARRALKRRQFLGSGEKS